MNISLTKFCNANKLPKSSVHRRCGELGIDVTNGLTPEAVEQLRHEFGVVASATPTAVPTAVPVEVGNHQIVLSNPQLPNLYSLESLRHTEAVTIEDPLAVAAQFLQVADGLTSAMQADIQAREARLNQTRQAKAAITDKARELQIESRLYRETTRQLDTALTGETQDLQQALAALHSLGKPEESAA